MKEQVLSVEQIQEVIDMGIDVSNASMMWRLNYKENGYYLDFRLDKNLNFLDSFPTFTLQDILEILPKPCYLNCIDNGFYQCEITTKNGCAITNGTSSLNAAFNMLKWCKENKYI